MVQAAGGLGNFDPRNIVRVLTIYQMKDRAGVVGANGVAPLVRDVLAAKDVRLHLIGHSFGGRVMLSAIAGGGPLPQGRKVDSLLLLQPAVNHLCFAEKVTNTNRPGGYREVLNRVRKPILSREGANVSLRRAAAAMTSAGGYGAEGWVYQAMAGIPAFDGQYAVIGSWIVGDAAAGIGMREDDTPITRNTSRFVPHYFL